MRRGIEIKIIIKNFHSILTQKTHTHFKWAITSTKEMQGHPLSGLKSTGLSVKWPEIEVITNSPFMGIS